jgi:GNAT superfamily N-acetyltransferase
VGLARLFQYTTIQQLDELHRLILNEAKEGHFEPRMAEPRRAQRMRENLTNIIRRGKRTDEPLRAELLTWTAKGKPAGWLINSEIKPGAGNEFWAVLMRPRYRDQGEGRRMLDSAINALGDRTDIYVRCYPASTTMAGMLRHRGFQLLDEEPDGNLVFKRPKAGSPEAVSKAQPQKLKPFVQIAV